MASPQVLMIRRASRSILKNKRRHDAKLALGEQWIPHGAWYLIGNYEPVCALQKTACSAQRSKAMSNYFVGIDGGGTSCRARIRDIDGNLIGEGKVAAQHPLLGVDIALRSITEAISYCRKTRWLG